MYYVYFLKSQVKNFFYTECTENLKKRFTEHNNGEVQSTISYIPLELIYYEGCLSVKDAYSREKYLKSRLGKNFLRKRLKFWFDNIRASASTNAVSKAKGVELSPPKL